MWRPSTPEFDEEGGMMERRGFFGSSLLGGRGDGPHGGRGGGGYGALDGTETETETEFSDELASEVTDSIVEVHHAEDEFDEPGILEVKIMRAQDLPRGSIGPEHDAQVQMIQGPNLQLLREFLEHAPPPLPVGAPLGAEKLVPSDVFRLHMLLGGGGGGGGDGMLEDDFGHANGGGHHPYPPPPPSYQHPHNDRPAEIPQHERSVMLEATSDADGLDGLELHGAMAGMGQAPPMNLELLARSGGDSPPLKPQQDQPGSALGDESISTDLPLHDGARPLVDVKVTSMLPRDGTHLLWDQLFTFDLLRKQAATADPAEHLEREDEEREVLGWLTDSGQLGQKRLLSDTGGKPIDLDRDDVLDADATVLLRVYDRQPHAPGAVLIGQTLLVIDSLNKLAGSEPHVAWHQLHSQERRCVGRLQVGMRFLLPHSPAGMDSDEDSEVVHEVELLSRKLFEHFDTNADGYLTRREFSAFVSELMNVGGNIKTLEDTGDRGCLGYCVPLPPMDLISYIKHRHTLTVVCFDRNQKTIISSQSERLGVVVMSLLWSLSSNCLVEVYMHSSRLWQVTVITAVDTFGTSVLAGVFLVSHWTHCKRLWHSCTYLPLVIFIIFLGGFSTWLLVAMTPEQLYNSGYSFLPIWGMSRVTEVFKLGTYWALMVQYGSSEQARKARRERQRREREVAQERRRRERLLWERENRDAPWWRFGWLRQPGRG